MPTVTSARMKTILSNNLTLLTPAWGAPNNVKCVVTTRAGGVSVGAYQGLNLGDHVGDDPNAVAENRKRLEECIAVKPIWLQQVHGVNVVEASECNQGASPVADGIVCRQQGLACAIMTADCLPILLCDKKGSVVAAAHAGWRGLADGVIEATIDAMSVAPEELYAYLGPAIGPSAFEVGGDVFNAFVNADERARSAFASCGEDKWLADIYALARMRLRAYGVAEICGGGYCTVSESENFYSYRRDRTTGRMASLIWIE